MWKIDYRYSNSIKNKEQVKDRHNPNTPKVKAVENGVVLPYLRERSMTYGLGGVLDSDGKYVEECSFFHVFNSSDQPDWGGEYEVDIASVHHLHETVIFAGFINNNEWGHFLTDWSSRLWYAVEHDSESRVVYCQRGMDELLPNIKKALKYAGISEDRLLIIRETDPPIQFDEILIPDSTFSSAGFRREYLVPFHKMVKTVLKNRQDFMMYDKIYLTRTGLKPNKDFGEKEIEKYYRSNGFHVLRPESLSLEEQIFYYANCSEVASLEGTPAHNIVFSKKGVRQTILEKSQAVNARQMMICQCCEAQVTFVGTYPRIKFYDYYSDGPFIVGITKKFCDYANSRDDFQVQAKPLVSKWFCEYLRYVILRVFKRIMQITNRFFRVVKMKAT